MICCRPEDRRTGHRTKVGELESAEQAGWVLDSFTEVPNQREVLVYIMLNGSILVATVSQIPIRLHYTFLAVLAVQLISSYGNGVAYTVLWLTLMGPGEHSVLVPLQHGPPICNDIEHHNPLPHRNA